MCVFCQFNRTSEAVVNSKDYTLRNNLMYKARKHQKVYLIKRVKLNERKREWEKEKERYAKWKIMKEGNDI